MENIMRILTSYPRGRVTIRLLGAMLMLIIVGLNGTGARAVTCTGSYDYCSPFGVKYRMGYQDNYDCGPPMGTPGTCGFGICNIYNKLNGQLIETLQDVSYDTCTATVNQLNNGT